MFYALIKMNKKITTVYAINLKSRTDRRKFILSQFVDKEEFQFYLVKAYEHRIGAMGLWMTIRNILKELVRPEDEYIVLCQDDHLFTKEYSKEHLLWCIEEARFLQADILAGGVSGFTGAIKITKNLYWVEKFSGLQFTIIFRKFFQKILHADFENINAADLKLCELTENKFFVYPFLSTQKEFGYSDVTNSNNQKGKVEKAFRDSSEKAKVITTVSTSYKQKLKMVTAFENVGDIERVIISVYITYLNGTREYLKQFKGRREFAVTSLDVSYYKVGQSSKWLSLQKIIRTAIENNDDLIIISRQDHQFTKNYERRQFIKLIWQAGLLGCNILVGGMGSFNLALPITNNLFWIDSFQSSSFFVIYRSFFKKILQESFCDTDTLESKFSEMTSNKMAIYPFISKQKDFAVRSLSNRTHFPNINQHQMKANERLLKIKNVWNKFNNQISTEL